MMNFKKTTAFLTALTILTAVPMLLPENPFLTAVADEEAPHTTQEEAAVLEIGTLHTDALEDKNDVRWYKFTTEADGGVSVNFVHEKESYNSSYWSITIYQEIDGRLKEFNSWGVTGNTDTYTTSTLGLSAGEYYMQVTSGNYSSTVSYDITVNLAANGNAPFYDWETEFNDSSDTADSIEVNQTYNGALLNKNDVDWYTFTTPEAGSFNVDFAHESQTYSGSYWSITIYQYIDNKLVEFRTWDVTGNTPMYTTGTVGVPAGEFYVQISHGNYETTAAYELTVNFNPDTENFHWESEFNNDSDSANPIDVNQTWNGALLNKNDVDWYTFTTPEDGSFTVDFSHRIEEYSSSYWTISIYYVEDGKLKVFRNWDVAGNTDKTKTNTIGIPAGQYYIQISGGNYNSVAPYELRVNYTAADNWEKESNDTSDVATEIDVNRKYNGVTINADDVDWYKFNAPTPGSFTLTFDREKQNYASNTYWVITAYLYKENKLVKLRSWDIIGGETKTITDPIGIPAGECYIEIQRGTYSSTSPYELTASFTPSYTCEAEDNNYAEDANEIKPNLEYTGSTFNTSDEDWYTFTIGAETSDVAIRFEHDNLDNKGTFWTVTLYQGNGTNKVNSWDIKGNETKTIMPGEDETLELSAGVYYLQVQTGGSAAYTSLLPYTLKVESSGDDQNPEIPEIPETPEPSEPSGTDGRLWGDIDGNGKVDAVDAALILNYAAAVGAGNTDLELDEYIAQRSQQ